MSTKVNTVDFNIRLNADNKRRSTNYPVDDFSGMQYLEHILTLWTDQVGKEIVLIIDYHWLRVTQEEFSLYLYID